MKDNLILNKTFDFSVRIINSYKYICANKHEFVMAKQLLRCGTSIGANVNEAVNAQSDRDFLSKMSIALKEATETEYWLKLLLQTEYLTQKQGTSFLKDCEEVKRILTAIIKTKKAKLQQ